MRVPSPEAPRSTLLHRLQADIRGDAEAVPAPLDPADRSVQFHACFGPMRQVQVARDAILHLLDDATGTTEEDVLVVCPDLERFAPLVEAVFGTPGDGSDVGAPALRYRIADRSIRSSNPVLGATAAMLDLVAGRFEITQVLDFLSLAPVRARFGFDESDLGVLAAWATGTRVRWGLDPVHRSGFGVPAAVVGNTWQAALDRLLLGSAVTDGELDLAIGGVAPFGVDSGDSELLGSFAFVLGRLADLAGHGVDGDRTAGGWVAALRRAADDLFAAPDRAGWLFEALDRVLADVVEGAASSRRGSDVALELVDVRRLLQDRLDREPGRPDYFRGGVTVTSMASLRWVPFRIVCVLGLDQDAAGSSTPDAADLMAAAPQIGDPDPRSESRQALLEVVLAAGDHLLVVRDGRDLRSNHPVPQVVPAAELFDAVVSLVAEPDRPSVRETLEVAHPRHPFDDACLVRDELVEGLVWSYSGRDLEAAGRRRGRPLARVPFLGRPLEGGDDDDGVVELEELRSFLRDPVGTFVQRTLGARLPRRAEEVDDVLPVELDGLETFRVGQELLDARAKGLDDRVWREVERTRGTLPPGVLEERLFADLSAEVDRMIVEGRARGVGAGPGRGARPRHHPARRDACRRGGAIGTRGAGAGPRSHRLRAAEAGAASGGVARADGVDGRRTRDDVARRGRHPAQERHERVATGGPRGVLPGGGPGSGCGVRPLGGRRSLPPRPASATPVVRGVFGRGPRGIRSGRGVAVPRRTWRRHPSGDPPGVRRRRRGRDLPPAVRRGGPGPRGRTRPALCRATVGDGAVDVGGPTVTGGDFDVLGRLPDGQVVIEASAGTGKTYTLASLATRFLAERDIAPSELLMVTFTRAATAELRSRIRGQLVRSATALAEGAVAEDDQLSAFLSTGDVPARRARLDRAVAEFDAAAISTIHSFAAQVRNTLGMTPAIDPDSRLTSDVADLVRHACADALATAATGGVPVTELPPLSRLVKATEKYVGGPDLVLEPAPGSPGAKPEQMRLHELVLASQANLSALLRDTGRMGFDDVLTQLRDVLGHSTSSAVVDTLRHRFKVVLIDEFQDTDRVQWEIFSTLFGGPSPHRAPRPGG